ncbi:MAG: hypothetical protein WC326_12320 [Candidatus Delongbacteria bacterium]
MTRRSAPLFSRAAILLRTAGDYAHLARQSPRLLLSTEGPPVESDTRRTFSKAVKTTNPKVAHKRQIKRSFNKIMSQYERDNLTVFNSDSSKYEFFFSEYKRLQAAWSNSRRCIFRDCNEFSIANSHSISRSFLANIAERGMVLTPEFNTKANSYLMRKRGISEASTFPGFCVKHEQLFNEFEQRKYMTCDNAIVLQFYRTICREIVSKGIEKRFWEGILTKYELLRESELSNRISRDLMKFGISENHASVKSLKFSGHNSITGHFLCKLYDLNKDLNNLINFHKNSLEKVIMGCEEENASFCVTQIETKIPVAISGLGGFTITENSNSHDVFFAMTVIPNFDSTVIAMYSTNEDFDAVKKYFERYLNEIKIISLVESWMINFTDNWFLCPKIWNSMSENKQDLILKRLQDKKRTELKEFELSIFDDLRGVMVNDCGNNLMESPNNYQVRIFLEEERSKLLAVT